MKYTSAEAVSQLLGLGSYSTGSKSCNMLVKAKDVNLHYASVSLKVVQENLKPSLKVGLFPKARAQTGSNLSASVFQHFMDQIRLQCLSHREITPQQNFILLPPGTCPTGQFKITPNATGEVIIFPHFLWILCPPQPVCRREV